MFVIPFSPPRRRSCVSDQFCIDQDRLRSYGQPIVSMQIRRSENLRQGRLRSPSKIEKPDCGRTFAILRLQEFHPDIILSRQHLRNAKRNVNTVSIQPAQSFEPEFFAIRSPRFIDNPTIPDELNHRGGSRAIMRVGKPGLNMGNAEGFASL